MANLTPLHFALNTLFRGTDWAEFEMHVNLISSVQSWDFDATAHQVAAVDDEGSHIVRSHGLALVPVDFADSVLEVILYIIAEPIAKIVYRSYGLLMRFSSQAFD